MAISWDPALYDGRHRFVYEAAGSLLDLLAPQPGERVLDLGCGTGHLTAAIREAGAEVVALDSSAEMLARARAEHPDIAFVEADARSFALDGPFDAVFSNAALHWIRPPEAAVACVARALKPGGRFVAEFGGKGNVTALCTGVAEAAREMALPSLLPDWYFPSVAEYAALLETAGLEVRLAMLFARPTPLEGEEGLRNWLRMFAPEAAANLALVQRVEELTRPTLRTDDGWFADYVRLRVEAVRRSEPSLPPSLTSSR